MPPPHYFTCLDFPNVLTFCPCLSQFWINWKPYFGTQSREPNSTFNVGAMTPSPWVYQTHGWPRSKCLPFVTTLLPNVPFWLDTKKQVIKKIILLLKLFWNWGFFKGVKHNETWKPHPPLTEFWSDNLFCSFYQWSCWSCITSSCWNNKKQAFISYLFLFWIILGLLCISRLSYNKFFLLMSSTFLIHAF